MAWTAEKFALAKRLKQSGLTYEQIGAKIGKTGSAVRSKIFDKERRNKPALVTDAKERIKELEQQLRVSQSALQAARRPRLKMKPIKHTSRKGDYTRVIIPDSHGCFIDLDAASAFLADLKTLAPKEIVMLGDHIDCGGFLAQHHTWGYVAEADYNYEDDVGACNTFLDSIQNAAPQAHIHYLEGNHERRIETWCLTQALRCKKDANFLLNQFSVEKTLNLKERGITFYKQGRFYGNCRKPNTLKLGSCYFTHGEKAGPNAARNTLKEFAHNVVFAHTHTSAEASSRTVQEGVIKAWNTGSLARLQPLWRHGTLTEWNHGYGVQFVSSTGKFLHVNVPIIEGASFLIPFTKTVGT